jgi:hypothetical protein
MIIYLLSPTCQQNMYDNLFPLSSMSAKALGQDPSAPKALETHRDPQKQIINY